MMKNKILIGALVLTALISGCKDKEVKEIDYNTYGFRFSYKLVEDFEVIKYKYNKKLDDFKLLEFVNEEDETTDEVQNKIVVSVSKRTDEVNSYKEYISNIEEDIKKMIKELEESGLDYNYNKTYNATLGNEELVANIKFELIDSTSKEVYNFYAFDYNDYIFRVETVALNEEEENKIQSLINEIKFN